MKILRAIGGFFAKIGRWIRDTAWVQPLLIVGGIFAIIFSIPYIVNGVKSWFDSGNASETYYLSFKKSMEGAEHKDSEADKLLDYVENREHGTASQADIDKYGDQFFISFVQKSCAGCETVQPGYETLQKNWNKNEFVPDVSNGISSTYSLYTIFIDEITDDELSGTETTFTRYFWMNHSSFFENAVTAVEDRPYYAYMGGVSSVYANLVNSIGEVESFQTPTTFMIDFGSPEHGPYGIMDIIFNFDGKDGGTSSYALARTLIDCWNHSGVFNGETK